MCKNCRISNTGSSLFCLFQVVSIVFPYLSEIKSLSYRDKGLSYIHNGSCNIYLTASSSSSSSTFSQFHLVYSSISLVTTSCYSLEFKLKKDRKRFLDMCCIARLFSMQLLEQVFKRLSMSNLK